jgi:hypothetical protein
MHTYLKKISESLPERFSELNFFVKNCDIMDPGRRGALSLDSRRLKAILQNIDSGQYDEDRLMKQLPDYIHDSSLDFLYQHECGKDPVKFFVLFTRWGIY